MKFRFEDDYQQMKLQDQTKIQEQESCSLNGESNVMCHSSKQQSSNLQGLMIVKNQLNHMVNNCKVEIEKQIKFNAIMKREIQFLKQPQNLYAYQELHADKQLHAHKNRSEKSKQTKIQPHALQNTEYDKKNPLNCQKIKNDGSHPLKQTKTEGLQSGQNFGLRQDKVANSRSIKSELLSRGIPSTHKGNLSQNNKNKLPFRFKID